MSDYPTVNDVVNIVASEVAGLPPVTDVFAANDPMYNQLITMLNTCGKRLLSMYDWERLQKEHTITTSASDSGQYTLPTDFSRMIDQTGWDQSNDVPINGPLSAQYWAYLLGSDLVGSTIYVSFRLAQGEYWIFPNNPVPDGLTLSFWYMQKNWAEDAGGTGKAKVDAQSDVVRYPEIVITRYLKAVFRGAKGFDNKPDIEDFNKTLWAEMGFDQSSPILNTSQKALAPRFLNMSNVPDTGAG